MVGGPPFSICIPSKVPWALDRSISPVRADRVGEGHPRVTRVAVLRHLGQRPTLRLARLTASRIRDLMSDFRESLVGAARSDYIRVAIAVGKGGRAPDCWMRRPR